MHILKWLFTKKEEEVELEAVAKLKKSLRLPIETFDQFFKRLYMKKELLDKIIRKGQASFNHKSVNQLEEYNLVLIKALKRTLGMQNFDDKLLKHLLVESATRLHHVSDELGIRPLDRSYRANDVEETKRRSYLILKDEKLLKKLADETSAEFKKVKEPLVAYSALLRRQVGARKNLAECWGLLTEEDKLLARFLVTFREFIFSILTKTKKFVSATDKELRKQALLYEGAKDKEYLLIIHSYGCTPEENREMAGYFASRGFSVFSPRLPGHGTTEDEFYNTSMEEVCAFGQHCLDYFYQKSGKPVFITGLSLGGMVTLYLATKPENYGKIKGIIPINAFIKAPVQTKVLDHLPYGTDAFEWILKKSGLRFLKKSSINLIKRRTKHVAKALLNLPNHQFKRSFENELTAEFLQRVDAEFKDILAEQIRESPEDAAHIREGFVTLRARLERKFRENYRAKKFSAFDIQDITRLLEFGFYNVMTYKGMVQLSQLSRYLQGEMNHIVSPLFVIQSEKDQTVAPKSAAIIYESCTRAAFKKVATIPNAGHMLILERQREEVFKLIEEFIDAVCRRE